jgi:tRNA-dihydrouridine synthase
MRIGSIELEQPLILAPMAGITDRYFRLILKRIGGVGLVTMEFISSEALTRGNRRTRDMMHFSDEERPLAIQIYGSKPDRMADAAALVQDLGADVVDINMGCPATKILKGCAGAALMADLDLAGDIIRAVRRRVSLPVTVKFRLGLDDRRENYLELGPGARTTSSWDGSVRPRGWRRWRCTPAPPGRCSVARPTGLASGVSRRLSPFRSAATATWRLPRTPCASGKRPDVMV